MERPEEPTCGAEVLYWYNVLKAGGGSEGMEKAERKLRCYAYHCSTKSTDEAIQFKWCCKNASPEYKQFAKEKVDMEGLLKRAENYCGVV